MKSPTETDLKEQSHKYWKLEKSYDTYCDYIDTLLGVELTYAAQHPIGGNIPRLQELEKPVHTIALTVGDSFEPLFQVICVLKPRRVVLILNHKYPGGVSGNTQGQLLRRLIARLAQTATLPAKYRPDLCKKIVPKVISSDTPTHVFRALRDAFGASVGKEEDDCAEDVYDRSDYADAVDITGAKKSMVAGAFLYAAHSGLPITYVDFDSDAYDTTYHRPYGYACRIGEIANPYQAFRLRDWERVRQLYERYDFRGALELIGRRTNEEQGGFGILAAMSRAVEGSAAARPLYDNTDIDKVGELVEILQMYGAWDSGDFTRAHSFQTAISNVDLPTAVEKLGTNWFHADGAGIKGGPVGFYANLDALRVYAVDELARIGRLIRHNQDYRSAFLRCGGLNEVVMVARFVIQFSDQDRQQMTDILEIVSTPGASKLFEHLAGGGKVAVKDFIVSKQLRKKNRIDLSNWVNDTTMTIQPMVDKWWMGLDYSAEGALFGEERGWDNFLDLRNILAHRYVSVSQDLAEDGLKFIRTNLEDFFAQPVADMPIRTEALPWADLCDLCRLDFLPPRLRSAEPTEEV